ncbi:N-acetyltransferase domain-containing protein [Tenacibaculum sp. 190130A14a]|uniref:N-acetyltransferase domain-containing protein n=1 Tax=Tenacibaculum polynesiense TaxID=3137857 RepID=A0ABM9P7D3_9FLAO
MNIRIQEFRKFEIPNILNDEMVWNHSFLIGTKHRLLAHYKNPKSNDDDIALLVAYIDAQIVGYMGVYIDYIHIGDKAEKIGWLSTWWLHKSSAGKGIGKEMLKKMYELNDGRIGISQFTPSAKRVYDKSGFFNYLKKLVGCKIDLRLNLEYLLPAYKESLRKYTWLFRTIDTTFNVVNEFKLKMVYSSYKKSMKNYSIDYLTHIDSKMASFLQEKQHKNLTKRDADFFQFIKTYQWIEEAPLVDFVTNKKKYFFSDYNKNFNIYLVKVEDKEANIVGFICLLRKDAELKVLQIFYLEGMHSLMAKLVIMHGIKLGTRTIITYDENLTKEFKRLKSARIRFKKKDRESIVSKIYGEINSEEFNFQYGDGDCSFA